MPETKTNQVTPEQIRQAALQAKLDHLESKGVTEKTLSILIDRLNDVIQANAILEKQIVELQAKLKDKDSNGKELKNRIGTEA